MAPNKENTVIVVTIQKSINPFVLVVLGMSIACNKITPRELIPNTKVLTEDRNLLEQIIHV